MAFQQENLHNCNLRPSPLDVFLSRIGIKKNNRKSVAVIAGSMNRYECITSTESPPNLSQQQTKDNRISPDPPASSSLNRNPEARKVKRRSSPFLRLVRRISMNKKTGRKSGIDDDVVLSQPAYAESSAEEIGASPSSSLCSGTLETSPRPAWSENDLRRITIRPEKDLVETVTPFKGVNMFSSEDNLLLGAPDGALYKKHTPSYLRVSCALSGYGGRKYRSQNKSCEQTSSSVPLGMVERRTLVFRSSDSSADISSPTYKTEKMLGAMVNTLTPVRQLVAQFDNLKINDGNKTCDEDSVHNKSVDSGAGGSLDGQLSPAGSSQLIEECGALPAPTTLHSSIPLSGQTLDKALSQPTPEPELAHAIHSGLRESMVSHCQPNVKNLTEIVVSELQVSGPDIARKVNSEDSVNLLSGEHFRKLLVIFRETLEKRAKAASDILESETDISELAADAIRLAVGKANLLLSRKMKKFAELIEKNLNPIDGDTETAKVDDLSAYWDLVKMELSDVDRLFSDVDLLRQNNWQPISVDTHDLKPSQQKISEKAFRKSRGMQVLKQKDLEKNSAVEKQRRQALAEAKRKLRQRMQQEESDSASSVL